jgi:hypothetical protein
MNDRARQSRDSRSTKAPVMAAARSTKQSCRCCSLPLRTSYEAAARVSHALPMTPTPLRKRTPPTSSSPRAQSSFCAPLPSAVSPDDAASVALVAAAIVPRAAPAMGDSPSALRSAAVEALLAASAASPAAPPAGWADTRDLAAVFSFQHAAGATSSPRSPPQVGESALRPLQASADYAAPALSPPPLRTQPRQWLATPPGGLPPPQVRDEGARSPIRWRTPPLLPHSVSPRRASRLAALPPAGALALPSPSPPPAGVGAGAALALAEEAASSRAAVRRDDAAAAAARSGVARLVADLEAQRWVRLPCRSASPCTARSLRLASRTPDSPLFRRVFDAVLRATGREPRARGGVRSARRRRRSA